MHHPERHHLDGIPAQAAYCKRHTVLNGFQRNMRDTRIQVFGKAIRDACTQAIGRIPFGIHGDIAELAIRTQIVQTAYVVVMLV